MKNKLIYEGWKLWKNNSLLLDLCQNLFIFSRNGKEIGFIDRVIIEEPKSFNNYFLKKECWIKKSRYRKTITKSNCKYYEKN